MTGAALDWAWRPRTEPMEGGLSVMQARGEGMPTRETQRTNPLVDRSVSAVGPHDAAQAAGVALDHPGRDAPA